MVGLIRSVNESATRIDYEIDDYTGPSVLVKQFVDDDTEPGSCRTLRELTYIRVYGHVRSFQGDINIVAYKVNYSRCLLCIILLYLFQKSNFK